MALVPAGFLVLLILAAIAVDSAVAFLGRRQLGDVLASAANDAAGAAVAQGEFYRSGDITIDPARAVTVVCQTIDAGSGSALHHLSVAVAVAGPVVGVRGNAMVTEVFGRLLPGVGQQQVSAVATAVAAGSQVTSPPPPSDYHSVTC